MKIILLGPPGTGKGAMSNLLEKEYGIKHISTGDIFRKIKKEDSDLGRKVRDLIDNGHYVPDEITNEIVKQELQKEEYKNGYILDGYPRTGEQAKFLDGIETDYVAVYINSSEEEIVKRLSSRRVCSCGHVYNLVSKKPEIDGICDVCGRKLFQRADDSEKNVRERLKIYQEKTRSLIDFYKDKGILKEVDGNAPIPEVFERIKSVLEK